MKKVNDLRTIEAGVELTVIDIPSTIANFNRWLAALNTITIEPTSGVTLFGKTFVPFYGTVSLKNLFAIGGNSMLLLPIKVITGISGTLFEKYTFNLGTGIFTD